MTLQIKLILAALIAALAFSSGWVVKSLATSKTIAELRAEQAQGMTTRSEAARTDETQTAIMESKYVQESALAASSNLPVVTAATLLAPRTGVAVAQVVC